MRKLLRVKQRAAATPQPFQLSQKMLEDLIKQSPHLEEGVVRAGGDQVGAVVHEGHSVDVIVVALYPQRCLQGTLTLSAQALLAGRPQGPPTAGVTVHADMQEGP